MNFLRNKLHLTYPQMIILGFGAIIVFGALLLMTPFASQSGQWTPFINALFTSTSCVCVTGLIVYDTATYWSFFGQLVIIILIQIGGLGVVTVITSLALITGKRIWLSCSFHFGKLHFNFSSWWYYPLTTLYL